MWTLLTVAFCAIYPALTVILNQELGPIQIHIKPRGLPREPYLPFEQQDSAASKALGNFLQGLLPKWDTTIKRTVHDITLHEIMTVFRLSLYDVVVKGFKHATLNSVMLRLKNGRLDFNASIPFISTSCTAFINGMIDDLTFASVGNLSFIAQDVEITGMLDFQEVTTNLSSGIVRYQIGEPDIKIDVQDIEVQLKIIEELEAFKIILGEFLSKPVDDTITSVSKTVVQIINRKLAEIPIEHVKSLLAPRSTLRIRSPTPYLRTRNYANTY